MFTWRAMIGSECIEIHTTWCGTAEDICRIVANGLDKAESILGPWSCVALAEDEELSRFEVGVSMSVYPTPTLSTKYVLVFDNEESPDSIICRF